MDGTDPESEALIWKLHRELNGLTRSSRRTAPVEFVSLHNPARSDTRKDHKSSASRVRRTAAATEQSGEPGESNKRQGGSPENSSQRGSKKKKTEYHDDAGSKDITNKPASSIAPTKSEPPQFSRNASKKQVARSHSSQVEDGSNQRRSANPQEQTLDEPQASKVRSCTSDGTHSKKTQMQPHPKHSNQAAPPPTSTKAPSSTGPSNSEKHKAPASSHHSPEHDPPRPFHNHNPVEPTVVLMPPALKAAHSKQQHSDGMLQWQLPCGAHPLEGTQNRETGDARFQALPATGKGSPLAAAAAAAATMVKEKARATQGKASDGVGRTLKCFHAGVRWGIALRSQDIQSRADLAQKLNDAFAGEILSCGRGDALHVIFVDSDGLSTEFPSLRSTHVKESQARWQAMVEKAVKIYVRRS